MCPHTHSSGSPSSHFYFPLPMTKQWSRPEASWWVIVSLAAHRTCTCVFSCFKLFLVLIHNMINTNTYYRHKNRSFESIRDFQEYKRVLRSKYFRTSGIYDLLHTQTHKHTHTDVHKDPCTHTQREQVNICCFISYDCFLSVIFFSPGRIECTLKAWVCSVLGWKKEAKY